MAVVKRSDATAHVATPLKTVTSVAWRGGRGSLKFRYKKTEREHEYKEQVVSAKKTHEVATLRSR
jgi:hypothetical protein